MRTTRQDYLDHQSQSDNVLVVIFLRGGADGLALIPPIADDLYHRLRPTISVGANDAISLDDYFAINARLRPLVKYYESGEMAIVHGAGSEDETRSHFEAQDFIEHGGASGAGWLARYLRAHSAIPSALSSVAIGTTLPESLRGAPSGAVIETISDFTIAGEKDDRFTHDLARLYADTRGTLGQMARDTLEAVRRLRTLRSQPNVADNGAQYPQSRFGRGMREIARLIKADIGLVATTIDLDGWDTHFTQEALIGSLMDDLAQGLDAFLTDLGSDRARASIVVMTEFGRRVRENTSLGTDHGLASTMFTFGPVPGIEGGRVHSRWRDLAREELEGPGDIPVGVNYRDVVAPILLAHAPHIDITGVFPGHRFGWDAIVG